MTNTCHTEISCYTLVQGLNTSQGLGTLHQHLKSFVLSYKSYSLVSCQVKQQLLSHLPLLHCFCQINWERSHAVQCSLTASALSIALPAELREQTHSLFSPIWARLTALWINEDGGGAIKGGQSYNQVIITEVKGESQQRHYSRQTHGQVSGQVYLQRGHFLTLGWKFNALSRHTYLL